MNGSDIVDTGAALGDIRVLLIEDHVQMRTVLAQMIESAPRLTIAFALARGNDLRVPDVLDRVDVALVDMHLPDTTGIVLAAEFSARTPPLPTLVISGDPNRIDREAALEAGAVAYLSKSIEPDVLMAAVTFAADGFPVASWGTPPPQL